MFFIALQFHYWSFSLPIICSKYHLYCFTYHQLVRLFMKFDEFIKSKRGTSTVREPPDSWAQEKYRRGRTASCGHVGVTVLFFIRTLCVIYLFVNGIQSF